ncbi:hypothetical protein [Actinoplanes sp. OR16]|uniref:hypothetical protein n=1 Tax=Actinoplanes sp. OR16 TaxID=946334 RepID=UPI000FD800BE|nr:hypothetical protein [Actinoplanes sp. OR16]
MLADALRSRPSGLAEALALTDGLDDALVHGLARIDEERAASLEALTVAFAGSPLAERVTDSIGKIIAGTVTDEHLAVLAGCRAALFGAVHDALLAPFGRERLPSPAPVTGPVLVAGGSRSWLRELAIAGWRGVDHELAAAGSPAVQALLADPAAGRLAVLLDGFAAELRAAAPVATLDRVPVRRWADLWSRALLLSQDAGPTRGAWPAQPGEPVDGRFLLLGADLHEHPTVFRVQAHGLLETAGGEVRLVRVSVAAPKVETITGPAAWRMLTAFPVLRGVLAGHLSAQVNGLTLIGGDLIWDESRVTPGEPADPFATARVLLGDATAASVPPLDRHPALIAEPVLLEGYTPGTDAFDLDGVTLPVDLDRLPAAGPITPALVAASTTCIGLLRWDAGRWSVQPLAVQATVKRKAVTASTADWALGPTEAKAAKAEAAAGTAVDVLRERAGRLLRK